MRWPASACGLPFSAASRRAQTPAAAPTQFDFPQIWWALWTRAVSTVQSIAEPW
uniref:Uncharacterized protein n=1 Tax=Setaria italica TaxID=4555 RepID=K3ZKY9_SETIT